MTGVRIMLFRWMMRQAMPVTIPAAVTAGLYVLLNRDVLEIADPWAWVFIGLHSLALTACWGRPGSRGGAYLYTRGFDRDTLWNHLMLATIANIVTVWGPAAAMIWTGWRCFVQDHTFQSPNFPIMAPLESMTPVAWLAGYVLLLATFHYAWIRHAHPARGWRAGWWMSAGMIAAVLTCVEYGRFRQSVPWWALAGSLLLAILLLALTRRLHRRIEVHI